MRWPNLTLPLACGAALGAGALAAAQFVGIFTLTPSGPDLEIAEELVVSSQDQHGWAMLILAVISLALVVVCLWFDRAGGEESESTISQTAAVALAVTGLVAALIFLIIDVPDANRIGALGNETGSFVDAKAIPQIGFWLELLGSLLLIGSGSALSYSALTSGIDDGEAEPQKTSGNLEDRLDA